MNLSDEDVDDTFTDEEDQDRRQTPLLPPGKCPHGSSDDEKSPSKKTKLDVSNLYRPDDDAPSQGNEGEGDGASSNPEKSKAQKPKKAKKSKKKRSKKNKNKKEEIDKKEVKEEKDKKKSMGGKKTPEKKKTPEEKMPAKKASEQNTPEKTRHIPSDGKNSETPTMPKSRKKPIRTITECQKDKWASDSPLAISYRQHWGIFVHTLPEGCNYGNHTDYIWQLMRHKTLGVNIKQLDDRIQELQGLTSSHHVGLLAALKEWRGKQMGNSSVTPQYVVKAFAEPAMQRKIVKHHDDHWHSDLMIGLYNIHQYDAICKENTKRADGTKPTALRYCPTCSYATGNHASINNHIRAHYRLLLECSYSRCVFVEADCTKMYKHGIKKHGHTKAANNA